MKKTILVLGGDGFCGWPTSLHLSKHGYDMVIIDNFSRRKIDIDLGLESLTPISTMEERIDAWHELTGKKIEYVNLDVSTEYERLVNLLRQFSPAAVVHFAEQRAAPYSMRTSTAKRYTVDNNVRGTHNVLCAIVESGVDAHLVHLGSMGVYGYGTSGMPIPEGYLPISICQPQGEAVQREIPYPPNPGSVYHMTKTMDALLFYFYNKNDKLRITDLHQGIVWGTDTDETKLDKRLINRFDYDGDYGTVLNRFLVQSVVGHPLTVHGVGGQTRAFIHIRDTVKCVKLAIENPPEHGDRVNIFNQATEAHNVKALAEIVSRLTGCEIRYYENPRSEDRQNSLALENKKFLSLGLSPTTLSTGLLNEVCDVVAVYRDRCKFDKIICTSLWGKDRKLDRIGMSHPGCGEGK